MVRIHYLMHHKDEGLGSIADWININACPVSVTRLYQDEPLPEAGNIDCLIIMGGPMGVHDEKKYPWLKREKIFIEKVIKADKKVLGICLGAQLIADVLGAKVFPNQYQEIGWFPIRLTAYGKKSKLFHDFPDELMVFHWHGDTFDLPKYARHLFKSEACENQAFEYENNILALQFHLEFKRDMIEKIIPASDQFKHSNQVRTPYIQKPAVILANSDYFNEINDYMNITLNRMLAKQ